MKNKITKILSITLALFVFMCTATGCGANKDDTTKVTIDENEIRDIYTGIDDVYVLKDAKDIDYLEWVLYDKDVVKGIEVDSSKVDISKEGEYKLTYKVTVDCEALTKYTKNTYDTSKNEIVSITKKATVVDSAKAQELADNNEVVYSGKDETVKKSDGSTVSVAQEAPASTTTTGGSVVNSSNKEEVKPETTAKPSNNNNGGNNSNSNKDTSSNDSGSTHTHTWVNITEAVNHPAVTHTEDVYETQRVCVKDAYDEQVATGKSVVCRNCGFTTADQSVMDDHMFETGHSCHWVTNYKTVHHDAVYENKQVKTGTKTITDKAAWTETKVVGRKCSSCGKKE